MNEEMPLTPKEKIPLHFLIDEKTGDAFIGRKKAVYKNFGSKASLFLGKVREQESDANEKKIFLDSLNPHVVFVCGARGSGKCLYEDTLITLSDGSQTPIKELEQNQEQVFGLNHSLKIDLLSKTEFFKRKVSKLLHLKLRTGKEIKLTPEHPLLTVNGWIPAEKLERGARIATPRSIPSFGKLEMPEQDIKLLAYLIAEGHLGNQFVLFSNTDDIIIGDFRESVKTFDENLRIEMHSKPGCFRIVQKKKKITTSNIKRDEKGQFVKGSFIIASKSSLMQWLESIGIYGKLSRDKFIPKQIFQIPKSRLSLFLNRLFSCDGTIHKLDKNKGVSWSIEYGSSSKLLASQVQHLLLRFGIVSRLRNKKTLCNGKYHASFELVIYGENVITFIKEIGFFGEKELKEEQALTDMLGIKRNPNTDTIPKEIWQSFKLSNWAQVGRTLGYSSPKSLITAQQYAPSREKLLKIAQVEGNKGVQLLAESDVFWDEIVEATELIGDFDVYDISVPEHHNFIANDIIVHNSYILGVIAEELALQNPNVGVIVIDPIGVFWSMKYPNKEEKEIDLLKEWSLAPKGLDNLKVFIPEGIKGKVPGETFDSTFAIQPSLLTADDWALTFGIDRFSPSGLLLDKVLKNVEHGYKNIKGKYVKAKEKNYSIDELIECLETDAEINSREKGFKQDSVRALVSRLDSAKSWGIFSKDGTPLTELSRESQLTVIDTSFLEDNVTALVIGILARRILAARKISTRKEAVKRMKTLNVEELLELEIPPTWLFIDEAHTLIPSGNFKTPASNALVEYVKQGRRPGCSLVFATQQPSAIDTKVLSQLDVLIAHKLIFDDDIKAVFKRIPSLTLKRFRKPSFIKTLPIGVGLTADRAEETSRAFVMTVRPRMSQHEGREAEAIESHELLPEKEAEALIKEMLENKIRSEQIIEIKSLSKLIDALNAKYRSKVMLSKVLDYLEEKGFIITPDKVALNEESLEEASVEEPTALEETELGEAIESKEVLKALKPLQALALPASIPEAKALELLNAKRGKKLLGLLGKEEIIQELKFKYLPVYRIKCETASGEAEFKSSECFLNPLTKEFIHFKNNKLVESKGLSKLIDLSKAEINLLKEFAGKNKLSLFQLAEKTGTSESRAKTLLKALSEKKIVMHSTGKKAKDSYSLNFELDIPLSPLHELLESMEKAPKQRISLNDQGIQAGIDEKQLHKLIEGIWPNTKIKQLSFIYLPVWEGLLQKTPLVKRKIYLNAVDGKIIE